MRIALMLACLLYTVSSGSVELPGTVDRTGQWTMLSPARAGLQADSWALLDRALAGDEFPGITSVLVAREGYLIYERYRDDEIDQPAAEILRDTRSATKTVTGMLIGIAIAQGHLGSVDDAVLPLFKDLAPHGHPDQRKAAISLKDLLTMSSLLECNDDNPYSSGNEERMYVTEHWARFVLDLPIKGFAPWMTKPQDSPYGRSFSYCTAGVYLLGAAIEKASGQALADFAAEHLERPLGINQVRWNRSPEGIGIGGGGTRYSSRDLLKLAELLRLGGRWGDRQLIPEAWVAQTLSVHLDARDDAGYGYLIWRISFPAGDDVHPVWAMTGNGGNYVLVDPQTDSVTVITSTAYNQRHAHPNTQRMYAELLLPVLRELAARAGEGDEEASRKH